MPTLNPLLPYFLTSFELDGAGNMIPFVLLSAAIWGLCVAAFMQYTKIGTFLSLRLTWFITALGCGGNLLLLLLLLDGAGRVAWWHVVAVFGMSSIGPSLRGILQHEGFFREIINGASDSAAK
jgi:hypothetical protein